MSEEAAEIPPPPTATEEPKMEIHRKLPSIVLTAVLAVCGAGLAYAASPNGVPVTVDNFNRAESDAYLAAIEKRNGLGKIFHFRSLTPIEAQTVIRMNRDTLYSDAVMDLDAGPITISLPDAGARYMSLQIINENQYTVLVAYGAGGYTITRQKVGTRYAFAIIRTLVDPATPNDLDEAQALQQRVKLTQKNPGSFAIPNWDQAGLKKVHDALLALGATLPDSKRMFGPEGSVDLIRHLIGTAMLWGGLPEKDATYLNVTPARNDGTVKYRLRIGEVPVDGFWSVSVYNAQGFFEPNKYNSYTLNSLTAHRKADRSVTIQFGGCDGKIPNCLPTTPGWNYTVRLYRPRPEILNGKWRFPEAQLVQP